MENAGPHLHQCRVGISQLQSGTPEEEKQVWMPRQKTEATTVSTPEVTAATMLWWALRSLTIPSWEPEQLGSTEGPKTQGQPPWGAHNPPQTSGVPARLSHSGHSPHTPTVCPAPLSPQPNWASEPPISCYFRPLLSGQGTNTRGQPTSRDRARTKVEHQELCEQRRKGNHSCSRRCNGLNPHNKPETVNSRGNCGFGEQV